MSRGMGWAAIRGALRHHGSRLKVRPDRLFGGMQRCANLSF